VYNDNLLPLEGSSDCRVVDIQGLERFRCLQTASTHSARRQYTRNVLSSSAQPFDVIMSHASRTTNVEHIA